MPRFRLRFATLPASMLMPTLSELAGALAGRPVVFLPFASPTWSQDHSVSVVEAEGMRATQELTRTWEPGRDGGWGYASKWSIEAPGDVRLSFSASGWEPIPNGLDLMAENVDVPTFRALRQRMCACLGSDQDQTDHGYPAIANVETALGLGERAFARELLEAALGRPGASADPIHARLEALRERAGLGTDMRD